VVRFVHRTWRRGIAQLCDSDLANTSHVRDATFGRKIACYLSRVAPEWKTPQFVHLAIFHLRLPSCSVVVGSCSRGDSRTCQSQPYGQNSTFAMAAAHERGLPCLTQARLFAEESSSIFRECLDYELEACVKTPKTSKAHELKSQDVATLN